MLKFALRKVESLAVFYQQVLEKNELDWFEQLYLTLCLCGFFVFYFVCVMFGYTMMLFSGLQFEHAVLSPWLSTEWIGVVWFITFLSVFTGWLQYLLHVWKNLKIFEQRNGDRRDD